MLAGLDGDVCQLRRQVTTALMPQFVAGRAERDQIFGIMGAAFCARHQVVEVQKSCVAAPFSAALVPIPGQHLAHSGH